MGIGKAFLLIPLMLGLNGCLGFLALNTVPTEEDAPEPAVETVAEPEAESEGERDRDSSFSDAVNAAMQAAEATQSAKSYEEWKDVAALWEQAIGAMEAVPSDDKNYSVAQQKAREYRVNLDYAKQNTGLTAVPYTVINASEGDTRRKKVEAYIAAPTAITREQRAETAIKAARELRQQQGADVISVILEPNPEQWGKGGAVAIARYAPDGKGYGQNDWTWEVEATGEPIDADADSVYLSRENYPIPTE